jgi:hypothetical protein
LAIEFTQRIRSHESTLAHAHGMPRHADFPALSQRRLRYRNGQAKRSGGQWRQALQCGACGRRNRRNAMRQRVQREFAEAITHFMKIGYDLPNSPPQHLLPSRITFHKHASPMTVADACRNSQRTVARGMAVRTEASIPNPSQRKS